jgi:hypothetical protein
MTSLVDKYKNDIPSWATHIGRDKGGYVLVFDKEPTPVITSFSTHLGKWEVTYCTKKSYDNFLIEEITTGGVKYEDEDI